MITRPLRALPILALALAIGGSVAPVSARGPAAPSALHLASVVGSSGLAPTQSRSYASVPPDTGAGGSPAITLPPLPSLSSLPTLSANAVPAGTNFTFQGSLSDSGTPANGSYDLQFTLWDAATGGTQIGTADILSTTTVSNGLFTVSLDFGGSGSALGPFTGQARWLEVAARPTSSTAFTTLTPRQPLTATPYALGLVPGAVILSNDPVHNALTLIDRASVGAGLTTIGGSYGGFGLGGVYGLLGNSTTRNGTGVRGSSVSGIGVAGDSAYGYGLYGYSYSNYGVYGTGSANKAGFFQGDVRITGNLDVGGTVTKGAGSFKIDDPLDPAHTYLYHSFVESPDMMDVYNGNITTNRQGEAIVTLPRYFQALNGDFRYQLTVIGQFAQAIVAQEIHDNRFIIRSDKPLVRVSWQVTGIRHDPYAMAHRIPVETPKPSKEQGTYLHPELYGQPASKGVSGVAHLPHLPMVTQPAR